MALNPALRNGIARRAGLVSGFLGMLCVLGELCFLLPDLLVTRDALPMYKAHIGIFRGVLQASILSALAGALIGLLIILLKASLH